MVVVTKMVMVFAFLHFFAVGAGTHMGLVGSSSVRILIVSVDGSGMDAEMDAVYLALVSPVKVQMKSTQIDFSQVPFKSGRLDAEVVKQTDQQVAGEIGGRFAMSAIEELFFGTTTNWRQGKRMPALQSTVFCN